MELLQVRDPSEIWKAVGFLMSTFAGLKHSPGASYSAPCPEEPCRLTSAIHKEFIHATGAQGGSYSLGNDLAGTDVTY